MTGIVFGLGYTETARVEAVAERSIVVELDRYGRVSMSVSEAPALGGDLFAFVTPYELTLDKRRELALALLNGERLRPRRSLLRKRK